MRNPAIISFAEFSQIFLLLAFCAASAHMITSTNTNWASTCPTSASDLSSGTTTASVISSGCGLHGKGL